MSDADTLKVSQPIPMARTSSGLLRFGFAVQVGDNTPYGAVIYFHAKKRKWGMSVSDQLQDRILAQLGARLVGNTPFDLVHVMPLDGNAGVSQVRKHVLISLLSDRQLAQAMQDAIKKRER